MKKKDTIKTGLCALLRLGLILVVPVEIFIFVYFKYIVRPVGFMGEAFLGLAWFLTAIFSFFICLWLASIINIFYFLKSKYSIRPNIVMFFIAITAFILFYLYINRFRL
ncbi:MAG: hypothetical protein JXB49_03590 [Bacteroidales bacterium]|nr:hypothetical protein [Bacteroidales bacterium]